MLQKIMSQFNVYKKLYATYTIKNTLEKIHKTKTDISNPIQIRLTYKANIPIGNYLSFNLLAHGDP